MALSAKQVMEFSKKTGVALMQCKKALMETDGDEDKALEILREKGMATAAKKASRIAAEGLVTSVVIDNIGVVAEVNCETDFVAKTPVFTGLVQDIAEQVAKTDCACVDCLLASESIKETGRTMTDIVTETVSKCGEKVSVRRFVRYNGAEGYLDTYIHMGGKIGVLLQLSATDVADDFKQTVHNISMHIAAANPAYLCRDDVPAEVIAKEREIARVQALNEGKKEQFVEKIVDGRINKFYKENCLLEQVSMLDPDHTITDLLKQGGNDVTILHFTRFEMGEGLEKRQDNFAEEVMSQMV